MVRNYCFVVLFVLFANAKGQFHQNNYDIEHDRIEVTNVNNSAVRDIEFAIFKYNETLRMKALNGSAYFTPGVYKNILVNFAVFKFVSKAYRPFPINITLDLCEEYTKNPFGLQAAIKNSNFRGCPCAVGKYYVYNFVLEQDKFPPHIPAGKFKLEVNVYVDTAIYMFSCNWYGQVIMKQH